MAPTSRAFAETAIVSLARRGSCQVATTSRAQLKLTAMLVGEVVVVVVVEELVVVVVVADETTTTPQPTSTNAKVAAPPNVIHRRTISG
jgi:hypothetical protein